MGLKESLSAAGLGILIGASGVAGGLAAQSKINDADVASIQLFKMDERGECHATVNLPITIKDEDIASLKTVDRNGHSNTQLVVDCDRAEKATEMVLDGAEMVDAGGWPHELKPLPFQRFIPEKSQLIHKH